MCVCRMLGSACTTTASIPAPCAPRRRAAVPRSRLASRGGDAVVDAARRIDAVMYDQPGAIGGEDGAAEGMHIEEEGIEHDDNEGAGMEIDYEGGDVGAEEASAVA